MSYDSHLDFAKDLLDFCKKISELDNSRIITRMVCARLYYALYHKALCDNQDFNPFNSKSSNLHSHIKDYLMEQRIKADYNIFYRLRQWSDYEIGQCPIKQQKLKNYIALCEALLKKRLKCHSLDKK